MTTSTKQRLLIAFSSVLVGCAVGATMPRLAARSFPPSPSAPRWEQFCEVAGYQVGPTNRRVVTRGSEGFESVSVMQSGPSEGNLLCFKRPIAR